MVQATYHPHLLDLGLIPDPGSEDWYEQLSECIGHAHKLLWDRIQAGNWHADTEAEAALTAYRQVGKAQELVTKVLGQVPLAVQGANQASSR